MSTDYDQDEPLTSTVRPQSMAILTIRIIKSFPYRSIKNQILKNVDLTTTTPVQLLEQIKTCRYKMVGLMNLKLTADFSDQYYRVFASLQKHRERSRHT